MYIIHLKHTASHEELDAHQAEHVAYIKEAAAKGHVVAAGRCIPRVGGVIMVNYETEEEVHAFEREEPYYKNGLADYEVIAFIPRVHQPGFEAYMSEADKNA